MAPTIGQAWAAPDRSVQLRPVGAIADQYIVVFRDDVAFLGDCASDRVRQHGFGLTDVIEAIDFVTANAGKTGHVNTSLSGEGGWIRCGRRRQRRRCGGLQVAGGGAPGRRVAVPPCRRRPGP